MDSLPSIPAAESEEEVQKTEPVSTSPSPTLPISNEEFLTLSRKKLGEAKTYWDGKNLDTRRRLNENFWIGKQLENEENYDEDLRNVDNLIYRDFETRITLAAARIPDVIVSSPNTDPDAVERERLLEDILNAKFSKPEKERLIKNGLRHNGLYFIGAMKVRWDKSLGKNGDYVYELVRPQNLILDPYGKILDDGFTSDGLEFVGEYLEEPLSVVLAKFPEVADDLRELVGVDYGLTKKLSVPIRYLEYWSTYFDKEGKRHELVGWVYKDLVLRIEQNPYFDHEGYEEVTKDGIVEEKYHNHFDFPRKPYIFFSYQNLGYDPLDNTSVVEQAIPMQRLANKRQRQITAIADRSVPKYFFNGKAITVEDAAEITNNPDEHVVLGEGQFERIQDVVLPVNAAPPSPILFQDLLSIRTQIDSVFATNAQVRGEAMSSQSGKSKQIDREGNLQVSDDLSRIVVQRVIFEQVNWAIQMMKLFYTEKHYIHDLGRGGKALHAEMSRDMIDDGLLVTVDASSTNKEERRMNAMALSAQQAIDPLTFMEELGVPNAKDRVERLMAFMQGPQDAFARYNELLGLNEEQAPSGEPAAEATAGGVAPEAQPQEMAPEQQAALVDQVIAAGGVSDGLAS